MAGRLPLSSLLSQVLVAFTIEFDNEFERRMPHRTTRGGSTTSRHAPWLVSLVMWANCMQFICKEGVSVRRLEELARTPTNLKGMERWGYIIVEPDPADGRPKPPRSDWIVRATPAGQKAQETWRPLSTVIERRWKARFGKDEIGQLRESLLGLVRRMDAGLPDCLPILRYGLFSKGPERQRLPTDGFDDRSSSHLPLPALLSRVLLSFAIEFERTSKVSLAIGANLVRVLDERGVRVRDLPLLTGVSKEAISMALGVLQKMHAAVVGPDPTVSGAQVARLTSRGRELQLAHRELLGDIEARWRVRFGEDALVALRGSLEALVGEPTARPSPLVRGLKPYPDGWRASVCAPHTLPHYPMVLHRGGFPDGS